MPLQKPGRSRQTYATPQNFLDAACTYLSIPSFVFDFAAEPHTAVAAHYWTAETNSLAQPVEQWAAWLAHLNGWGWLNPPFDKITPWAARCAEVKSYGERVAFLVPASVGANWHRDWVDGTARVLLLNGRLQFDPAVPDLYPKDCMLCLYAPGIDPGYEVWTWK